MKKLLYAAAAVLALAAPANAAIIADLGVNPRSQQGHFSNDVGGSVFTDQYTFTLLGAPAFITFASATNDFTGGTTGTDFITNFVGQLFSAGADLVVGGGDDFAVNAPVAAVGCPGNPGGCQILAGQATLGEGTYFLQLTGDGGGTSGYGGNLTVAAVPEPATWLMMIMGFAGVSFVAMRKRREQGNALRVA
jgi:hypothetical protein